MEIVEKETGKAIVFIDGDHVYLLDPQNYEIIPDENNEEENND